MLIHADRVAQRRYVRAAHAQSRPYTLTQGPAVLRGLRDLGFRDPPAAVAALVDNAIDARASRVDVLTHTASGKVSALAIIDDGVGMVPEMIRAACAVGGACRIGDGPHLGREGFGLPAAPLALGQRFTLMSRPQGGALFAVTCDLNELGDAPRPLPEAVPADAPRFVREALAVRGDRDAATVVLVEALDRITMTPAQLRRALLLHLGLTFGGMPRRPAILVDGEAAPAIDPLFLDPAAPGFTAGLDGGLEGPGFAFAYGGGEVRVRSALLPMLELRRARGGDLVRAIRRATEGLLVSRLGRRIAPITEVEDWRWPSADSAFRIEIDVTPELDSDVVVALSMQSVRLTGRAWRKLRHEGLDRVMEDLRRLGRHRAQLQRPSGAAARSFTTAPTPAAKSLPNGGSRP